MAAACALAIFSGKSIIHFGIAERLRTLRYSLFTEGVVKDNGITPPPVKKLFRKVRRLFGITNKKFLSAIYAQSKAEGIQNCLFMPKGCRTECAAAFCLSGYPVRHHSTMMLLPVISAGTGRPI